MKATKIFLALGLIAGLTGCSAALVNSDFDRDVYFAGYETFDWAPQPQESDSSLYAENALLDKRLRSAVEQELTAKGLKRITTVKPDFLITYRVDFKDKLEVVAPDHVHWSAYYGGYWPRYYGFGYWPGYYYLGFRSRYYYGPELYGAAGPYLREYHEVTVTVDFLNPETKELIWRGWYIDEVKELNLREEQISEAVKRLLDRFPPEQKTDNAPVGIT